MEKDKLIGKKYIKGLEELEVTLKSEDELYATLKNTENLKSQITLKELKYPVKKGDTIGVIKYFTETGQVIGSVDIISANDVDNISFITKIKMILLIKVQEKVYNQIKKDKNKRYKKKAIELCELCKNNSIKKDSIYIIWWNYLWKMEI